MIKRCIATLFTLVLCMVPTGGLLLPARAAEQPPRDFANLVLFAYFSDEPNKDYFNQPSTQPGKSRAQALMELYDGQQGRSFRQYMNTISGGRFQVHNLFPQWDGQTLTACELPFTRQQAQPGSINAKRALSNVGKGSFAGLFNLFVRSYFHSVLRRTRCAPSAPRFSGSVPPAPAAFPQRAGRAPDCR